LQFLLVAVNLGRNTVDEYAKAWSNMLPSRVKKDQKNSRHPGEGPIVLAKAKARSRVINGVELLPGIDRRSVWYRRFRDLNGLFAIDLGGDPTTLSEGQRALVRRAAALCTELELMETRFARNGGAKVVELEVFQRATNSLRRVLECLGIHRGRIARDVTPPDLETYLKMKAQADEPQGAEE
jgi:hypothetical protein